MTTPPRPPGDQRITTPTRTGGSSHPRPLATRPLPTRTRQRTRWKARDEARRRKVDLVVLPTAEAIGALTKEPADTNAVLHLTC